MTQPSLSARAFHRVLKVAPTIADLTGVVNTQPAHLVERSRIVRARDNY